MKPLKVQWLMRALVTAPYFTLCTEEAQFERELKSLGIKERPVWVPEGKDARVHHFTSPKGAALCIVCVKGWQKATPIEIAGLLVHEAVHIWQGVCEQMGEWEPSKEFEAYSIQSISQQLWEEFVRQRVPQ
jgi:hypothetical protein